MSEQSIVAIIVAAIPALLVYLNEHRKINGANQVSIYDKQRDWILKLEGELDERDKKIYELEETLRKLEARIKELEEKNEIIE